MREQIRLCDPFEDGLDHLLLPAGAVEIAAAGMPGTGVFQRLFTIEVMHAGIDVEQLVAIIGCGIQRIVNRLRHVDGDAPNAIHKLDKCLEVEPHIIVNLHTQVVLHGFDGQSWPAAGMFVGVAEEVRRVDAVLGVTGDRHPQVAWNREHTGLHRHRIEGCQDHRVGAPEVFLLDALIDTEDQHGDAVGIGPHRQRLTGDALDVGAFALRLPDRELRQNLRDRDTLPHLDEDGKAGRHSQEHVNQQDAEIDHQLIRQLIQQGASLC